MTPGETTPHAPAPSIPTPRAATPRRGRVVPGRAVPGLLGALAVVLLAVMLMVGALAGLAALAPAAAQTGRPLAPSGEWVTDRAGLLSPDQKAALAGRLAAFEDSTSNQIVVVILPALDGADPAMYATELGQAWGVGQGDRDNGIVFLVSTGDRQLFIATGFGLEGAVPDAIAGRIVNDVVVPRFREGDFYAGIDAGVTALMAATRGEYEALPQGDAGNGDVGIALVYVVFLLLFFVLPALRRGGRGGKGRRRGGPGVIFFPSGSGWSSGGGGWSSGGGGFGGGGFSGGGGGFGGGGAGGSW